VSQTPPMSAPPPPYLPPAAKQANIPAIISLVTGILSCIPGLGFVALIVGIIGLAKAGKTNARGQQIGGKGLAISGIILGLIGIIWTGSFILIAFKGREMIAAGAPARAVAKQFALDVGRGDANAAAGDCSTAMAPGKVRAVVAQANAWGALQDTHLLSFAIDDKNGLRTATVAGVAEFANVKKKYTATLDQEDGVYRIEDFTFADEQ
jgi:hypothetical protein